MSNNCFFLNIFRRIIFLEGQFFKICYQMGEIAKLLSFYIFRSYVLHIIALRLIFHRDVLLPQEPEEYWSIREARPDSTMAYYMLHGRSSPHLAVLSQICLPVSSSGWICNLMWLHDQRNKEERGDVNAQNFKCKQSRLMNVFLYQIKRKIYMNLITWIYWLKMSINMSDETIHSYR